MINLLIALFSIQVTLLQYQMNVISRIHPLSHLAHHSFEHSCFVEELKQTPRILSLRQYSASASFYVNQLHLIFVECSECSNLTNQISKFSIDDFKKVW